MTTYNIENLDKFADKIEINIEQLVRSLAMSALEGVTAKSPVDTGRFKGSWQVSAGKVNKKVLPTGKHNVPGPGQKISKAIKPSEDKYVTRYVTNNLDYGPALEDGHSGQAPNGMVKLTMQELKVFMRKEVRRIRESAE